MPYDSYEHRIEFDLQEPLLSNAFPLMFAIDAVPTDSNYTTKTSLSTSGTIGWVHYNGGTLHNFANAIWTEIGARGVVGVLALRSDGVNIPPPPPPPPTKNGYGILTIINKSTNDRRTTTVTGCPPPTACTTPPIVVSLGETLRAEVYLYKCDGSYWYHVDLGDQTGYIKSGACGDPGEDHTYGSGTVGGLSGSPGLPMTDWAWMQTEFAVSADMIAWITRQKDANRRSSLYFNMTVEGYGWYSGEVALDTVITPPPPPPTSCEELYPNRGIDLWQAIGYGFCVAIQPGIALLKYVIDNTEWFWGPVTRAIGKIKITVPDWLGDFKIWVLGLLPNTLKTLEAWAKDPVGEAFKLASGIGAGIYTAGEQVFKAVDPLADLFNPSHYQTDEVKAIAQSIYSVLHLGEFNLYQLIASFLFAPWMNLYDHLENLTLGTTPATYENAKARAAALTLIQVDLAALITGLDALTSILPRGVRILDKIPTGVRSLIAAVMVYRSVSDIMGPAIDHGIKTPLERQWKSIALDSRPTPSEYMSLRAEGLISPSEYMTRMAGAGYSEEWSAKLYDEYLQDIRLGDISTLLRRGKITETQFNNFLEVARVDPKWRDYWRELVYSEPNFYLVRQLALSGNLTEAQLNDLLKRRGVPPEYLDVFRTILLQSPGMTQRRTALGVMARLVVAKLRSEADYYAYADSAHIARSIADPILQAEKLRAELGGEVTEREASLAMWNAWYLADIVDASEWREGVKALGYDSDTLTRELAYLDSKKKPTPPPTEREATRAMWDTWYLNDVISASVWRAAYEDLLYDTDTIARQLAYLDKKKAPPIEPPPTEREATLSMWGDWYMQDIVSALQYREGLIELRYPVDVIERELAILDKRKEPKPPPPPSAEATLAMWNAWYTSGIKTATEYTDALTAKGYDAETITTELTYLDQQNVTAQRDLLQSEASRAFKDKVIDEATYRARLEALARTPDAIDVIVATDKAAMATAEREVSLAIYADAYRYGAMERPIYLAKLIDAGYTNENAELIIATKELSWATGVETLTAEQTLNSWEQGFLTLDQTIERLKKRAWTDSDIRIRLSFSVIDMLKAKHLTNPEADKLWTDLAVGLETRTKLLAWYGWTPA